MIFVFSQKAITKLTLKLKKKTGHNNSGKIVINHIGSMPSKRFRLLDTKHYLHAILGKVLRFEQDPYRNSLIALIAYTNGMVSLILKPINLKITDYICNSAHAPFLPGNSLQLKDIPIGSHIHNIELYPGGGSQIIRAAGCYETTVKKNYN
jgi:large subunit ribosomal protein L2